MGNSERVGEEMIGISANDTKQPRDGWRCPNCGRGLNPNVITCPCYVDARGTKYVKPDVEWPERPRMYEVSPREMDGYKYTTGGDGFRMWRIG